MPRINRRWLHSGRRPLKTAVLVCAVAIPALAGCEAGLNAPTLQYHPAAEGAVTAQANGITINNAFVLGPALKQQLPVGGRAGVFLSIASASQDTLTSVSAPGTASSVKLTGGPVSVPANGQVNMTGPAPRVILTGLKAPLSGGQSVTLVFTFANAGNVTLQLPVEPHAYDYATFAQPPTPSPGTTPTPGTTPSPGTSKKAKKSGAHPSASTSANASTSTSASRSASASPSTTP